VLGDIIISLDSGLSSLLFYSKISDTANRVAYPPDQKIVYGSLVAKPVLWGQQFMIYRRDFHSFEAVEQR
jgi:hypothetical protein